MTQRYEVPPELLGTYRQMTISEVVEEMDPDGFTATPEIAERILAAIREVNA